MPRIIALIRLSYNLTVGDFSLNLTSYDVQNALSVTKKYIFENLHLRTFGDLDLMLTSHDHVSREYVIEVRRLDGGLTTLGLVTSSKRSTGAYRYHKNMRKQLSR